MTNTNSTHTSMRPSAILKIAQKNLFSRPLRTFLTVLGVIIGVSAIVFLISFGIGLQKLVENQVIGSKSIKTIDVDAVQARSLKFNDQTIQDLSGIANIDKVSKIYTIAGKIKTDASESSSVVYAVDKNYFGMNSFNKLVGEVNVDDVRSAVVNSSFLKTQGIDDNKKALDRNIAITFSIANDGEKDKEVTINATVKGVIESEGGSEVFISNLAVESQGLTEATQIKVLANDREDIQKIRTEIESRGFNTSSPIDTISEIDRIFQILQIVLIGFGGIGLIIAVLGMFNTLTITLLERTKEIGLMVTIGSQQKDIRRLFTAEALMLSLIGGFCGVVLAFIMGKIADLILNNYARGNGITDALSSFHFSPLLVLGSLVVTVLIGLVVVYLPARRASRISPLDAMRE